MTDAAYCAKQTERERKSLARMSRYKKNGSRTNYVRLPQTYMTEKEICKMHGEITTMSLGKRYTKEEFLKFDDELRKLYIQNLIDKYGARRKDIANMLGLSYGGFAHICQRLFPVSPFKNEGKGAKPTQEWLEFAGLWTPPKEFIVEKKPEPTLEPPKVQSATLKVPEVALSSMRLRFVGDPAIAFAKAMKLIEDRKSYDITIEIYPAMETPECLPF